MSAYLDDIARNMDALKGIFLDLGKECKKIGLAVNVGNKNILGFPNERVE